MTKIYNSRNTNGRMIASYFMKYVTDEENIFNYLSDPTDDFLTLKIALFLNEVNKFRDLKMSDNSVKNLVFIPNIDLPLGENFSMVIEFINKLLSMDSNELFNNISEEKIPIKFMDGKFYNDISMIIAGSRNSKIFLTTVLDGLSLCNDSPYIKPSIIDDFFNFIKTKNAILEVKDLPNQELFNDYLNTLIEGRSSKSIEKIIPKKSDAYNINNLPVDLYLRYCNYYPILTGNKKLYQSGASGNRFYCYDSYILPNTFNYIEKNVENFDFFQKNHNYSNYLMASKLFYAIDFLIFLKSLNNSFPISGVLEFIKNDDNFLNGIPNSIQPFEVLANFYVNYDEDVPFEWQWQMSLL